MGHLSCCLGLLPPSFIHISSGESRLFVRFRHLLPFDTVTLFAALPCGGRMCILTRIREPNQSSSLSRRRRSLRHVFFQRNKKMRRSQFTCQNGKQTVLTNLTQDYSLLFIIIRTTQFEWLTSNIFPKIARNQSDNGFYEVSFPLLHTNQSLGKLGPHSLNRLQAKKS